MAPTTGSSSLFLVLALVLFSPHHAQNMQRQWEPEFWRATSPGNYECPRARNSAIRVATFNVALFRRNPGALLAETETTTSEKMQRVAATIQIIKPDIILLNEVDYDPSGATYRNLNKNYFRVVQSQFHSCSSIDFPFFYAPPSNTGMPSGVDFNRDGELSLPADAYGYGFFPGQYGMVLFSKFPMDNEAIRTFQNFLWKDMPNNLLPTSYYSPAAMEIFRLSSKNHIDVPIILPSGKTLHLLCSHPTPPGFDSVEFDENGRRNADEIRFWSDYITANRNAYIYDDDGQYGGLVSGSSFVIAGDLNADPYDGDSRHEGIATLLSRYNVVDPMPKSVGGELSDNNVAFSAGDPALDTSYFNPFVGSLRIDYTLPSADLEVRDARVFWPSESDPLFPLAYRMDTSDHRAVFVEVFA